jgi:hypothetical protein
MSKVISAWTEAEDNIRPEFGQVWQLCRPTGGFRARYNLPLREVTQGSNPYWRIDQ